MWGCVVDVSAGVYNSAFLLAVVFCNGLHLLQREVALVKGTATLVCGYKDKYLESRNGVRHYVDLVKWWL